jgi:hypothetical protein
MRCPIGVYSDRRAFVSSLAFHLVSLIAPGCAAFWDLVYSDDEEPTESELFVVEPYSQNIRFTFPSTNQMDAASFRTALTLFVHSAL